MGHKGTVRPSFSIVAVGLGNIFTALTTSKEIAATSGIPTTPQAVTGSNVTITDHATDARTATTGGDEGTTNVDLYMSLTLYSSGIDIGEYTGTITFSVTN